MDVNIEIYKKLNVKLPIEKNLFWRFANDLTSYLQNKEVFLKNTFFRIFTINNSFVFRLEDKIPQKIYEIESSIPSPLPVPYTEEMNIEGYTILEDVIDNRFIHYIICKDDIIMDFSLKENTNDIYEYIMNLLLLLLKKEFTTENIVYNEGSIYYEDKNKKKTMIVESFVNLDRVFIHIRVFFNQTLENKILNSFKNHNEKHFRTGILNKNIKYNVDNFINEISHKLKQKFESMK